MEKIADLHIHSRFSRATSKDLNIANLVKYAGIKGVDILGTGDFTHPLWLQEINRELKEENGILKTKDGFPFILSSEISLMYSQEGRRSVHLVFLAPSLDIVGQINKWLDTKGRRDYDGRPIFGFSCIDFIDAMNSISKDIEVIPAHCLLPDTYIQSNTRLRKISDLNKKDLVWTHRGRFKSVNKIMKRHYSGKIYTIKPWYFREGLSVTPEHPFYVIKSFKNCLWIKGLCKPLCSQRNFCKKRLYKKYTPVWEKAEGIEKGDFLVYPRFKEEKNLKKITLTNFVKNCKIIPRTHIILKTSRNWRGAIKKTIEVNNDFCRLIGYYASEGYLIGRGAIGFSFHSREKEYIDDVRRLVERVFGLKEYSIDSRREKQADIIFNSQILNSFFSHFYCEKKRRAYSKFLPNWVILLPKEKLAEVFRGWWRGDTGYTASRQLANQMKLVCLKLGIVPSISIDTAEAFNKRGKHFIGKRKIMADNDLFVFSNLSFFDKDYGMLSENCFRKFVNKVNRKHGWIDNDYVYMPVREIKIRDYDGEVYNLAVEEDNSYVSEFACIHNCWTPYFGVFGSESGFNSLKEAFGDKEKDIHAIETGMSSDPSMNWKIEELDSKTIVSFSDLHSFWPWRMGREATIFNLESDFGYRDIIKQIRENSIFGTIETDPAYGRYHYDGHRNCNFSCSPRETSELGGICPVCKKNMTIGVESRVEKLAAKYRPAGFRSRNARPFYKILPLHELIALMLQSKIESKKSWEVYNNLINKFGSELNILLKTEKEEMIREKIDVKLIELIIKNRIGNIKVKPGYDGEYGKPMTGEKQERLF